MIGRPLEFKEWAEDIRSTFELEFGTRPSGAPNLSRLTSMVQERMMRCGIEARLFGIEDRDELAILAHHTLLQDDLRHKGSRRRNFIEDLYGVLEAKGLLDTTG